MPIQGLGPATKGLWKDYAVSDPLDNKWQRILDFLGQRLAEISIASGYKTDIGANVFFDRPTDISEDECPGIIYFAEHIEPDTGVIGAFRWALPISINIIATGSTAKATVNKAVTDVLNVIKANQKWDNLAVSTGQPTVTPSRSQQQDRIISSVKITLPIIFDTAQWEI